MRIYAFWCKKQMKGMKTFVFYFNLFFASILMFIRDNIEVYPQIETNK